MHKTKGLLQLREHRMRNPTFAILDFRVGVFQFLIFLLMLTQTIATICSYIFDIFSSKYQVIPFSTKTSMNRNSMCEKYDFWEQQWIGQALE